MKSAIQVVFSKCMVRISKICVLCKFLDVIEHNIRMSKKNYSTFAIWKVLPF